MAGDQNATPNRRIFINYRRTDHPDFVERIRDWFAWKYGRENVFMDFDTIPPFTPFAHFIREEVRKCDVLVAIIGPQWVDLLHERMAEDDSEDYARLEIRLALEEEKLIAPVCIKKAGVPLARDLPPDIKSMLDYNVAYLDSGRHFLDNIEMLMESMEKELNRLEGLRLIQNDIQQVQVAFDVFAALRSYQQAAEREDWRTALDWLTRIRKSGFAPEWYPLADYEKEAREGLWTQDAERSYNFIRIMAERESKGKEDRARIWAALQDYWAKHPGYDPDNLGIQFRPITGEANIHLASVTLEASGVLDRPIDLSIFNQLNSFHTMDNDPLLDPQVLAAVVQERAQTEASSSFSDAQKMGIEIDWDEEADWDTYDDS